MGVEENDLIDNHDIDQEKITITEFLPSVRELVNESVDIDIKYFPPILWKIGITPLGDQAFPEYNGLNYFDYGSSDDDLIVRAKAIRSRYTKYEEFDEAINTYWEYMDRLIAKYGTAKLLKKFTKLGLVTDYIPKKPKLKNTKRNRDYFKYGVAVSETKYDSGINPFDNDESRAQVAKMFPVSDADMEDMNYRLSPDYVMTKEERAYYKKEAKWAKKAMASLNERPRRKSIYAKDSDAVDSIRAYFDNISGKKKSPENDPRFSKYQFAPVNEAEKKRLGDDYNEYADLPLTEVLKYQEFEDEEFIPDELRLRPIEMWEKEQYHSGIIIGEETKSYVNYDEATKVMLYTDMAQEGFDVFRIYGKSLDRDYMDTFNKIAKEKGMRPKEIRKFTRKCKKDRKKSKEYEKQTKGIIDALLNSDPLQYLNKHIDENGVIKPFHLSDMPDDYT